MPQAPPPYRLSRAIWGVAIYLIGFLILLFVVSKYYLIPAFVAEQGATPEQRRILVAHSWLILALVLFVLFVGLLLTFRVGRFFFPTPRERTSPLNTSTPGRNPDDACGWMMSKIARSRRGASGWRLKSPTPRGQKP